MGLSQMLEPPCFLVQGHGDAVSGLLRVVPVGFETKQGRPQLLKVGRLSWRGSPAIAVSFTLVPWGGLV